MYLLRLKFAIYYRGEGEYNEEITSQNSVIHKCVCSDVNENMQILHVVLRRQHTFLCQIINTQTGVICPNLEVLLCNNLTRMSHTMQSLYCLLIVLSHTVAFILQLHSFLCSHCNLFSSIVVALLEFTQQVYSVQENLGPLIVNLQLTSSSPSLATNLPANSIQVLVTSSGGTAIGTCNSIIDNSNFSSPSSVYSNSPFSMNNA